MSTEPEKYAGLTQALVRELVDYDPETGIFTDKVGTPNRKKGSVFKIRHSEGYITIILLSRRLMAHRLAIFYVTGKVPPEDVDHINGVRDCNIYSNLRCASRTVNSQNRRKGHSHKGTEKTSSYLGVCWDKNRSAWISAIKIPGGKRIHIGRFDNELDAHRAYVDMKRKIHEGNML